MSRKNMFQSGWQRTDAKVGKTTGRNLQIAPELFQLIDHTGDVTGSKTVINIDHTYPAGATG